MLYPQSLECEKTYHKFENISISRDNQNSSVNRYNPLRSKNVILRVSTTPVYDNPTSCLTKIQKTILWVSQNSQFTEITQNLINEELQSSLSINIHDIYVGGVPNSHFNLHPKEYIREISLTDILQDYMNRHFTRLSIHFMSHSK